jgi:hypothetical protein
MATDFKILRGSKSTLIDENGVALIPEEKLVNGYWYLTNDTAEVFVCLEIDGHLTLKKINECDINQDFSDLESFETRLDALEAEEKLHTYGYRSGFPITGIEGHMYVAADEQKTYVWFNDDYLAVGTGDNYEKPEVIFGGTAD